MRAGLTWHGYHAIVEKIRFDVLEPHPQPEPVFRAAVASAARDAFGSLEFWNEVWVTIQLYFPVLSKREVRGDIDNYIKNVLDGLTGIAFNDDSQVVGVHAFWIDRPGAPAAAQIEIEGMDLVDMEDLEERTITAGSEEFTVLVVKNDPAAAEVMMRAYRASVEAYVALVKAGLRHHDARSALPIICCKYPRKGPANKPSTEMG